MLIAATAGCGGGSGADLLVNGQPADDADPSTVAGELVVDDPQDFSHGILTLAVRSGAPIELTGVRLVDTYGDIELVDAYVAGTSRPALWISSSDVFPPPDGWGAVLEPLEGYAIAPVESDHDQPFDTIEVINHLRVHGRSHAGYGGFCVTYVTAGAGDASEVCVDHAFEACVTFDPDVCSVGA